jgi:nitrate reductase gamma subunit
VAWPYKLHIWLGLLIFFVFPFSRLVHIWSAPVGYVFRKPLVVRRRGGALAARAK